MKFRDRVRRAFLRQAVRVANRLGGDSETKLREWLRSQLDGSDYRPASLQDLMELPPSYASVRVVCDAMAGCPIRLLRRTGERQYAEARDHPLWPLLTTPGPNALLTTPRFVSLMQAWLCLEHDALAAVRRNGFGEVERIIPVASDLVVRTRENLRLDSLVRTVRWPDGVQETLLPRDTLWLQGFGITPLVGLRLIDLMAGPYGRFRAASQTLEYLLSQGTTVPGFVVVQGWTDDEVQRGREHLKEWEGPRNAGRGKLLNTDPDTKIEWVRVGMTAEESQMTELRQQDLQDQARLQVVSPIQVGDLSHGTYSNVEQEGRRFLNQTLGSWVAGWQHGLAKWLLHPDEQRDHHFKIDTSHLTMGSMLERYQGYQLALQGWMSPNDVREIEDRAPFEGGDQVVRPLNMAPVGSQEDSDNDD